MLKVFKFTNFISFNDFIFLFPKAILDRHLYGIIFFLFGIDVILLTIWMVISPYNMKVTELSRVVSEFFKLYTSVYLTICLCMSVLLDAACTKSFFSFKFSVDCLRHISKE